MKIFTLMTPGTKTPSAFKALLPSLAVLVALVGGGAAARAQGADAAALHTIRGNAEAVQDNARTYQWRRVSLEVDRIVSTLHAVEGALTNDPSRREDALALRQAIIVLRRSRLQHDAAEVVASAREVAAISRRLSP